MPKYTATHWGLYEIVDATETSDVALAPFRHDPDPSPIGLAMLEATRSPLRVQLPAVRKSWLARGPGARTELRGREPFVEVSWDEATRLVAGEIRRARGEYGNEAIFGGSYGWSSAGRFHHAQSHIHRFLNAAGGYARSVQTYSLGAAKVILPHVLASMDEMMTGHTSWDVLAQSTELFVAFGGVPLKNTQVSPGGPGEHTVRRSLERMRARGVRFVNISPVRNSLEAGPEVEWIPIRPNTDTALLLALTYVLVTEGRHDEGFLESHAVGFEQFLPYLLGRSDGIPKDARWAEAITGVAAHRIVELARRMANRRTMLNMAWSLQRAHHGEQPFWMLVTLAAALGQIGLPGGGLGFGYGAVNMIGSASPNFSGPTLPQGRNPVEAFIPVARIADMLLSPGHTYEFNGARHAYPHARLVYWAGGNPFHHHQNLARLVQAWQRPETIIVHEQFWNANAKHADIVLPATTTLERTDIGYSRRERYLVAMSQVIAPVGQARNDFDIFCDIAQALGVAPAYSEGLDAASWQRRMYEECVPKARAAGVELPAYDTFLEQRLIDLHRDGPPVVMFEDFRHHPAANPLCTPSGKIEIFSSTIAGFGYDDCAGHARWYEPLEWLGSPLTQQYPLHLLTDQPHTKLHSQLDHSACSRGGKIHGREPLWMHPDDAAKRGIAAEDYVLVRSERGACVAAALLSTGMMPGVVKMATGSWFDQPAGSECELHGNPNALTPDIGTSRLAQGCSAESCLVEVTRLQGDPPATHAFAVPEILRVS